MTHDHNDTPLKNLPSALAFRRGVVVTDAPLEYGTASGAILPVPVFRHGVMGTQNVNEKKVKPNEDTTTVAKADRDVRNLQVIESAKTGADMVDLRVSFSMKALPLKESMHSCANSKEDNQGDVAKFRKMLADFTARAENSEGLQEVSRRIARNLCNGRWLWRNRLIASCVRLEISAGNDQHWEVPDALQIPLHHFEAYTEAEKAIGAALASGFCGVEKVGLQVQAILDLGVTGSMEVFCSQNYEPDTEKTKDKGGLSRSLYKLPLVDYSRPTGNVRMVGQAAFRDAKIWNALRTLDTWYPDYAPGDLPIPIEPQGASLALMQFLRAKTNKKFSAFELFKRLNQIDPDSAEGMYCIASLLRGGVFGESEKNRESDGGDK